RWGHEAVAAQVLRGVAAGSGEVRQAARHPARYPLARVVGRGAPLGDRGRRRVDQEGLVWRETLLRLAGDARLQDARARAPVALSRLHALPPLPRSPPDAPTPVVPH